MQRGRVVWRGLGTLVLLAAVAAAGAPADAVGRTSWDGTDVRVSDPEALFAGPNKNIREPTVAIDPADPQRMIAFAIDLSTLNFDPNMYGTNRGFLSTDGGRTWSDRGPIPYLPGGTDVTYSGDPVALFGPGGVAYLASLASFPTGDGGPSPGGIYVHRSFDGGETWGLPVLAVEDAYDPERDYCNGTDKEWLSADPRTGRLYLAYTLFEWDKCTSYGDPFDVAYYSGLSDLGIWLTTSDDQGGTWSAPRKLWRGYALGAFPQVTPDGTILIAFWSTVTLSGTVCPTAVGMVPARAGGSPFAAMVVARSTDGGGSWSYHQEPMCGVEPELLKPGAFVGGNLDPSLSVDASTGIAYVAWPAYSPVDQRFAVKAIASADSGGTWSAPVELREGEDHALMPFVEADAGVARLIYMTTTPDAKGYLLGSPGAKGDTFLVESTDGGRTWSDPFRLSTASADYSGSGVDRVADVGDYIGMDVAGGRVAAIWTDARNGNPTEIRARVGTVRP